ncbi:oxidoreductase [Aureococcus anophagefferens]|nr:oxidoreductase [Aureococcus anophagefferens]
MASNNEHLLQETLRRLPRERVVVVTRSGTRTSATAARGSPWRSLKSLGGGVDVVMLLHCRCRDDIAWMRCAEEAEAELRYRRAGPAPGADAWSGAGGRSGDGAGRLAAIGVSNFDYDVWRGSSAAAWRHVYQNSVWAFLFDPRLVELLREHRVRFVAYNVMNGVVARRAAAPGAAAKLDALAAASGVGRDPGPQGARSLGVATVPRASSEGHLAANAPPAVAACGALDPFELGANAAQGAVRVFWENESTGERVPVTADIAPGPRSASRHPGHKFVAYRGAELLKTFTVTAPRGGWQEFEL